jgi:hypothetical protein
MGTAGAQGIQGPQGETGPAGPQGDQGETGPAGSYTAGAGINIVGDQISADDSSPTNELQNLQLSGTNLSLSNGGGSVDLSGLPAVLSLPYFGEDDAAGPLFHIQNNNIGSRYGIAGTTGTGAEMIPANRASSIRFTAI